MIRIKNYTQSIARFVAAGCPVRDPQAIGEILVTCQKCERYNAKKKICNVCGCHCNNSRYAFVNKIRMASESCPIGKWS